MQIDIDFFPSRTELQLPLNNLPSSSLFLKLPSSETDDSETDDQPNTNTNPSAPLTANISRGKQLPSRFDSDSVLFLPVGKLTCYHQASIPILRTISPVFHDMFTPEKLLNYGLYRGGTLVRVEDDQKDLEYFLAAIYRQALPHHILDKNGRLT